MVDAQSSPSARLDPRADTAAGFGPVGGAFAAVIIISIMAICARCKREQRSNQRSFEMTDRQSSYEPPVVQGERVPTPMGRVPPSKLDSPRGAVV